MKNSFSPVVFLAGVALLVTACHPAVKDPKDPKFVVAEKGDWQVLRSQLDSEIAGYLQNTHQTPEQLGPQKMPILETLMLDNIVFKKLMLDKAATMTFKPEDLAKDEATELERLKGPLTDDQFQEKLKQANLSLDNLKTHIHEKVLIGKVLQAEAFKDVEPTDQEINTVYLQNKDRFVIPPKVRASRILILVGDKVTPADLAAKKKAIDKAHDRVVHGEDFAKVAQDVSEDQYSKSNGGDIGFFQRGESESPDFDLVAFGTKVGQVSPVFQTPLGFQFLKVTDTQAGGVLPIAEVRSYIADKLRQKKMQEQQQAYSKKVLAESGVIYHIKLVDLSAPQPPANPATPGAPAPTVPSTPAPAPPDAPSSATPPTTAPAPAATPPPAAP